jgi:hypothetical protein
MQSQLPSAWSQIRIENDWSDSVLVTNTKQKKRKRGNVVSEPVKVGVDAMSEFEAGGLSEVGNCSAPSILKPEIKMVKKLTNKEHIVVLDIRKCIEKNISQLPTTNEKLAKMLSGMTQNLEQIVSSTNYRSVLKSDKSDKLTYTNDIKFVSKSYEDTYLRQPITGDERKCVRGNECECMHIDPAQKFIGVEYVLPWETDKKTNGMCLPCVRATTQILFYDIIHSGVVVNGIIQRFYNKHSIAGEYKLSNMLICPPNGPIENLPMPILRHQRNLYTVRRDNNIYHMTQINVDFQ